jgi:hypothetical protein
VARGGAIFDGATKENLPERAIFKQRLKIAKYRYGDGELSEGPGPWP